jgi:putative ABC transport system permease protein
MLALLMLAGGITVSACCYAILDAAVYRAIPFQSPDRLVEVVTKGRPATQSRLSLADFKLITGFAHSFENVAYEEDVPATLERQGQAFTVMAAKVSSEYFRALGLRARIGRLPGPGDFGANSPMAVVISDALWKARFSSNPSVPGSRIRVDNEDAVVIGVLPENVRQPVCVAEVWICDRRPVLAEVWDKYVVGRLRPSITIGQAAEEIAAFRPAAMPGVSAGDNAANRYALLSVVDQLVGPSGRILKLVLLACLILQVLACISVGQLMLARRIGRMEEMGVRLALGASIPRLAMDVLLETAMLTMAALAAAAIATVIILPAASAAASTVLGSAIAARITPAVAGFSTVLAVASALLCALFPVFLLSRLESFALIRSRWETGPWNLTASRLQEMLMVVQVGGTIVLMMGFGLLIKSVYHLTGVPIGFDSRRLSCLVYTGSKHPFPASSNELNQALLNLSRAPGVESAGAGSVPILAGAAMRLRGVGARTSDGAWASLPPVLLNSVSAGYFGTLGVPVVDGRAFTQEDRIGSPCVAIVNQALARGVWPVERAVGQEITLNMGAPQRHSCEVVGVVGNMRDVAIARPPEAELFVSMLQNPGAANAVIFVRAKPGQFVSPQLVNRVLLQADPTRELELTSDIGTLVSSALAPGETRLRLFGAFACIALLLAAGGSYAAARFGLSLRVRELGIRLALGARPLQIVSLTCGRYLRLSATGVLLGIAASAPFLHLFARSAALLEVGAFDMTVAATVSLACLTVIMASVVVPTVKALKRAPSQLLLTDADRY